MIVVEAFVFFVFGPPTARLSWINNFELALIGGIVFCLSYIFKYGAVLQQQSDETNDDSGVTNAQIPQKNNTASDNIK